MSSLIFFNRGGEEYFIGRVDGSDPMFVAEGGRPVLVLGSLVVEKKDIYTDATRHFVGASLETMIAGPHWDNPDCWEPPSNKGTDADGQPNPPEANVEGDDAPDPEGTGNPQVEGDDAPPVSER